MVGFDQLLFTFEHPVPARAEALILEELRALLAVTEAGNFVRAAAISGVPRPTLRRRIASLETRVGTEVVVREHRVVSVTPAGEVLLRDARSLLAEVDTLVARARVAGTASLTRLRAAMPLGVPTRLLAGYLPLFQDTFPGVTAEVTYYGKARPELLDQVDVLLHVGTYPLEGRWFTYRLATVREQLMASHSYLAKHGTPATLAELDEHTICMLREPDDPLGDDLPLLAGGCHPSRPAFTADDPRVLEDMAQLGTGIAMCAFPGVVPPPDELVPILPDIVGRERQLLLMVRKSLTELPELRTLFRMMRAVLTPVGASEEGGV